jgi:transcriptional regulator with XRE-family HTH domain
MEHVTEVGEQISNRRHELGLTQLQVAQLARVSPLTLIKLESGTANPTWKVLGSIAGALGLELVLRVKAPRGTLNPT